MRKLKIFLAIIAYLLIVPFTVFAEGDTNNDSSNEDSRKVKLYFFHGNGCPHCAEAEEFFDSIQDEYGDKFKIVAYEVWYNSDNSELLQKIGEVRDESITGVPYIMIGNKSWSGYSSELDSEIKEAINSEYEKEVADRYDIANYVDMSSATAADITSDDNSNSTTSDDDDKTGSNDALAVVLMLVVAAGIGYGVVVARNKTV